MKEGSVVLAVIQQADGQLKKRPAVVLRELPGYHDLLICGVSSQLHQEVKGFDEIVSRADSDFVASGLQSDSLIRLGHLMAISPKHVEGEIGSISTKRRKRLLKNLSNYLVKKP
jgi:mRNA interferase MazF